MLRDGLKQLIHALYSLLRFYGRRRFALLRFGSDLQSGSEDDVALLKDAFVSLDFAQVQIEDRIRHITYSGRRVSSCRHAPIKTSVIDDKAPWLEVSVEPCTTPNMIGPEETQYYEYIGALYEGMGAAVELGPWLGGSTRHIIRGLKRSTQFNNKKLYVFDDFIWRKSWMDNKVPEHLRRPNHSDFRDLFESFVKDIQSDMIVSTARIADYDGNEHLPVIAWTGEPVEIMYIDCGRTMHVNEAWFKIFSPSFIPNVSLLVMQDWRTHRERPRLSINEMLWFTTGHPEMELIHEVSQGGTATFLYRGPLARSDYLIADIACGKEGQHDDLLRRMEETRFKGSRRVYSSELQRHRRSNHEATNC